MGFVAPCGCLVMVILRRNVATCMAVTISVVLFTKFFLSLVDVLNLNPICINILYIELRILKLHFHLNCFSVGHLFPAYCHV
jgi:hypothetical protein